MFCWNLSFICIAFIFFTIYSLINCSVYGESCRNYSLLSFRFFSQPFVRFLEKNKNVIHQPRSVRIRKNYALCLAYPRPRAQFFPIRTDLGCVVKRTWMIKGCNYGKIHIYIYIDTYIYFLILRGCFDWTHDVTCRVWINYFCTWCTLCFCIIMIGYLVFFHVCY